MPLVALSKDREYEFAEGEQDCRGWTVCDASGGTLGTCTELLIDTDAPYIKCLVLDTGARVAASTISLSGGVVHVLGSGPEPAGEGYASPYLRESTDRRTNAPKLTPGDDDEQG